jgi:hypothetical protein
MTAKEIQKSETEKIMIALREYKGKKYVDIRQHFKADSGDYLPTKKGITFSPEALDEAIEGLKALKVK